MTQARDSLGRFTVGGGGGIPATATRAGRVKVGGLAVRTEGLTELRRAFRRISGDLDKDTREALRRIARPIRDDAQGNVQHKTGRHGQDGPIRVKVGVTQRSVSIYANAPHAAVQDFGGRVGHGAIITRASASHYMTKAVREGRDTIERGMDSLGDEIGRKFSRG